jgi:hypothetical protein
MDVLYAKHFVYESGEVLGATPSDCPTDLESEYKALGTVSWNQLCSWVNALPDVYFKYELTLLWWSALDEKIAALGVGTEQQWIECELARIASDELASNDESNADRPQRLRQHLLTHTLTTAYASRLNFLRGASYDAAADNCDGEWDATFFAPPDTVGRFLEYKATISTDTPKLAPAQIALGSVQEVEDTNPRASELPTWAVKRKRLDWEEDEEQGEKRARVV